MNKLPEPHVMAWELLYDSYSMEQSILILNAIVLPILSGVKMRVGQIMGIVMLTAVGGPAVADCLQVEEHKIVSNESSYGQIWVEWEARIHNQCEEDFYTMVTIHFKDAGDQRIHNALTSTMIKEGETVTVNKRSLVDEDVYKKIEDSAIVLKPEKLPNKVQ